MKQVLIINLAEAIQEYVGDLPQESWGYETETAEYGCPESLAFSAATGFFGYLGSDDPDDGIEEAKETLSIYGTCQLEPNDIFWFDVHHCLDRYKDDLIRKGMRHCTDMAFVAPNLILEVSNEMDMVGFHDKQQQPRG